MAKQLEQFKKNFEAIKHTLTAGELEVTKEKTNRGPLDTQLEQHAKEIGRRVHVLRQAGKAGTKIDDFKSDAEVKKLLDDIDHGLTQIGAVNQRVKTLETGEWQTLNTNYTKLVTDLTAEIAARKKELST